MKLSYKKLKKQFHHLLSILKINYSKLFSYKLFIKYKKDKHEWLKQGGKITKSFMVLSDFYSNAGISKGHYFHQDLLVANYIYKHAPKRHIDIASRIDGFVAHVASFRVIEVFNLQKSEKIKHENIKFFQADLMDTVRIGKTDSLSCLHAIEHFGLGRYNDTIDVDGHNKGISNMIDLVKVGGRMYISFPIGNDDEVYFNAHRVFHPTSILQHPSVIKNMKLIRFDYVDDNGDLHLDKFIDDVTPDVTYGCGIYTFEKF